MPLSVLLFRLSPKLPVRLRAICVLAGSVILFWHVPVVHGRDVDEWIRAQAASMPLLPVGAEAGSPKYTVLRFNATPLLAQGGRYGGVRIACPAGRKLDLVWMFSDVTNIDEYHLISLKPGAVIPDGVRQIYEPTAKLDIEDEAARGHPTSSLPRPWDLFQLHMLGVPAAILVPGDEYIIWFRFSDRRPTDVLMAATFISPLEKMEPAALPPVFGLPPQLVAP
jgi:hypothetical protein